MEKVQVFGLTAIGINPSLHTQYENLVSRRARSFQREEFPFSKTPPPAYLSTSPIKVSSGSNQDQEKEITIFQNGIFFCPTLINRFNEVNLTPKADEIGYHRSKGKLLFDHVYQGHSLPESEPQPCFIFSEDKEENCISVYSQGTKSGHRVHTYHISNDWDLLD